MVEKENNDEESINSDDNLFGVEVRRKLKLQALVTSKLGKHKDKERNINAFYNKVWPALETLGWKQVHGQGRMEGSVKFIRPGKNVDDENLTKDVDYYETIRDVLDYVLNRSVLPESDIAKIYLAEIGKENQDTIDFNSKRGRRRMTSSSKLLDLSWKDSGRLFPKRTSSVGLEYQVKEIPPFIPYNESEHEKQYELVWDPVLATEKGIDLESADPIAPVYHSKKEEALIVLHEAGYDTSNFTQLVEKIKPVDGSDWSVDKKKSYHEEIFRLRKDLEAVSKVLAIPMKSVLTYYLGTYKTSDDYRLLKTVLTQEDMNERGGTVWLGYDSCAVCGDGGSLVICDGCESEYHLNCLAPPLRNVPEGHWECDECVDRKLIAARNFLLTKTKLFKVDESKKRKADESEGGDKVDDSADEDLYVPTDAVLEAVKKFCTEMTSSLNVQIDTNI